MKHLERIGWIVLATVLFFGWVSQIDKNKQITKVKDNAVAVQKSNFHTIQAAKQILARHDTAASGYIINQVAARLSKQINSVKDSIRDIISKAPEPSNDYTYLVQDTASKGRIISKLTYENTMLKAKAVRTVNLGSNLVSFVPGTDSVIINRYLVNLTPQPSQKRIRTLGSLRSIVTFTSPDTAVRFINNSRSYTYIQPEPIYGLRGQLTTSYNLMNKGLNFGVAGRFDFRNRFSISLSGLRNFTTQQNSVVVGTTYDWFR